MNSSPKLRPSGTVRYENTGRVVLVTGGAQGIGLAICKAFCASKAQVVCLDVQESAAARLPEGVIFRPGDTSSESDCRRAVTETVAEFGGLDVLVNNAAIQPTDSYVPVDELDSDVYEHMVAVNLSGYTFMAKHALRQMRRQQSGVVINVASEQGHRTARAVPVYGPLKAANILQAMQWGIEFARDGIRVVSVSPGAIDTPLVRASLARQGGASELARRHPVGRIGRAAEVANAVLWLASSDASFVTATDLAVDGGLGGFGAFADPYPPVKE